MAGEAQWALMSGGRAPKAHLVEPRGNGWTAVCGKHTRDEPTPVPDTAEQCSRCFRMADGTWSSHAKYPSGFGRTPAAAR